MENQELAAQENRTVVTLGNWMITLLLMCIPLVNIILLFVWAFSGGTPASKSNWAKATLIWMAIGGLFLMIFGSTVAGLLATMR